MSIITILGSALPHYKAIDTRQHIVQLHGGIGIYATLEVEHTMHHGHDSTNDP
jgi:hypothetical protein